MINKLLGLVRHAIEKLQSSQHDRRGEEATRDAWIEQLSDFQWIEDESDRPMPPEKKEG